MADAEIDAASWESGVRASYDRVAAEYAERIAGELADKPFDRALLDRFADLVRPLGAVCDVGCGPGHVAAYLYTRGLDVFGVDLAPEMVAQARRLNPGIRFERGTMLALDLPDGQLGGIVAFYSIVNVPRESQPAAFAELRRVLHPGGWLLVAFHLGEEDRHLDEWWDQPVSIDFYFYRTDEIVARLVEAGFVVEERLERDPYPEVEHQSRRAYLLARSQ